MTTEQAAWRITDAMERIVQQNDTALAQREREPEDVERLLVAFERIAAALEGIVGKKAIA